MDDPYFHQNSRGANYYPNDPSTGQYERPYQYPSNYELPLAPTISRPHSNPFENNHHLAKVDTEALAQKEKLMN